MSMTKRLYESGSLVDGKSAGGRWRIRIMTEGEGSSGIYSRELLENYGNIFASRPMFGNHPKDPSRPWERSPFEIRAKLGPTVEYEVVDGVAGIYADIIADTEVEEFLEKFHDVTGVSIFASGDGHENEDGKWVVESFDGSDPYTSVDFVVAPGRGGGAERVLEAYRALEDSTAPADADNGKDKRTMDEATKAFFEALLKPLTDKVDKLQESLDGAVALVESVKDAQPERVEAIDAAGELATAVAEAKLGEKAVARVLESVKAGKTVADAVKYETDLRSEILAESHVPADRFGGTGSDSEHDYTIGGLI